MVVISANKIGSLTVRSSRVDFIGGGRRGEDPVSAGGIIAVGVAHQETEHVGEETSCFPYCTI